MQTSRWRRAGTIASANSCRLSNWDEGRGRHKQETAAWHVVRHILDVPKQEGNNCGHFPGSYVTASHGESSFRISMGSRDKCMWTSRMPPWYSSRYSNWQNLNACTQIIGTSSNWGRVDDFVYLVCCDVKMILRNLNRFWPAVKLTVDTSRIWIVMTNLSHPLFLSEISSIFVLRTIRIIPWKTS